LPTFLFDQPSELTLLAVFISFGGELQGDGVPQTLQDFLASLDCYKDRVPLAELTRRMEEVAVDLEELRDYLIFGRDHYRRNLLRAGPAYHALLLCWRAGQRSPIHDHNGSTCAVRVLKGVATETQFEQTRQGWIYPTLTRKLPAGTVCAAQDQDIHQMSNLQSELDLVTLHIYSLPLLVMGQYSLTDPVIGEFTDPIFEFALGGGI
jgi:cysteine dioxygenase